ncbi:MAG: rhomboid family intramembrane serine protease [Spirulinaceae cyanobacterium SM2_1_0]|nr:rhomboid family intramembrane serine protease [Spirulinaceae cyanobacterium SM2_1_0]
MQSPDNRSIASELRLQATILGAFVAIFWGLEIADQLVFQNLIRDGLDNFGIQSWRPSGVQGILFAPFLHGGFGHLIANTVPFVVLGWLVMLQATQDFFIVTGITMLIAGIGTWLFGAPGSIHIGASSLVFGYLGFLLLRGYFERNVTSILMSILVFSLYGGVIWGVFPQGPGISWQGHLFGFIGGILAARWIGKARRALRD